MEVAFESAVYDVPYLAKHSAKHIKAIDLSACYGELVLDMSQLQEPSDCVCMAH